MPIGQLAEERRRPIGMDVYLSVDRNATYVAPEPEEPGGTGTPAPTTHP